jgi:hypothetical protein
MIVTRMMITDHLITGDSNITTRAGTLMIRGMMINQGTRNNMAPATIGEAITEAGSIAAMIGRKTTGERATPVDQVRIMITLTETMDLLTEQGTVMNQAGKIGPITGVMKGKARVGIAGIGAIEMKIGTITTAATTAEMTVAGGTKHPTKYLLGLVMIMQSAGAAWTA